MKHLYTYSIALIALIFSARICGNTPATDNFSSINSSLINQRLDNFVKVLSKKLNYKNSLLDSEKTEFKQSAQRGAKIFKALENGKAIPKKLDHVIDLFNFLIFASLSSNQENFATEISGNTAMLGKIYQYFIDYGKALNKKMFYNKKMFHHDGNKNLVLIQLRTTPDDEQSTWFSIDDAKAFAIKRGPKGLTIWVHDTEMGVPATPTTTQKATVSEIATARKLLG